MKNEVMGLCVTFVVLVGWSTAALQWLFNTYAPAPDPYDPYDPYGMVEVEWEATVRMTDYQFGETHAFMAPFPAVFTRDGIVHVYLQDVKWEVFSPDGKLVRSSDDPALDVEWNGHFGNVWYDGEQPVASFYAGKRQEGYFEETGFVVAREWHEAKFAFFGEIEPSTEFRMRYTAQITREQAENVWLSDELPGWPDWGDGYSARKAASAPEFRIGTADYENLWAYDPPDDNAPIVLADTPDELMPLYRANGLTGLIVSPGMAVKQISVTMTMRVGGTVHTRYSGAVKALAADLRGWIAIRFRN